VLCLCVCVCVSVYICTCVLYVCNKLTHTYKHTHSICVLPLSLCHTRTHITHTRTHHTHITHTRTHHTHITHHTHTRTITAFMLFPDRSFDSFHVIEMAMDSLEAERRGLCRRRMMRVLAPQIQENPIFFHLTNTSSAGFRVAVDQMVCQCINVRVCVCVACSCGGVNTILLLTYLYYHH